MKPVQGYLSDDGTFFDTAEDAKFYDAMHRLSFVLQNSSVNPERFITVIDKLHPEIRSYLDAKEARDIIDCGETKPVTRVDTTNNGQTTEAILEFTSDGDEPVSDVGRGQLNETLSDGGPFYGPRGRRSDAPGLRSNPDMATPLPPEAAEPRAKRGK